MVNHGSHIQVLIVCLFVCVHVIDRQTDRTFYNNNVFFSNQKNKADQEAAVSAQKVKKLESLCRALQAELHKKKVDSGDPSGQGDGE